MESFYPLLYSELVRFFRMNFSYTVFQPQISLNHMIYICFIFFIFSPS